MKAANFISIFFVLNCGIFGDASTKRHLPPTLPTIAPTQYPLEQGDHRTPKQLYPSQNIYPSKNFINSKLPQNSGQPQLFNLGYSVRFEPQQNQIIQNIVEKAQFTNNQNGDIITGTRKQNVEIDRPNNPNEISQFNIKNDIQKRKIFGSKPAATPQSFGNRYLESMGQSYISPTTQKNLKILENIKDVDNQQELSELYKRKYTWRNLSPNVKIIQSTEIPTERLEIRALDFDHEKALSKSEGFGFSDAMRSEDLEGDIYSVKETKLSHVKEIPTTQAPEDFRVIHVKEQINEPPMKTRFITDPDTFTLSQNLPQGNIFQGKPQVQTQTKIVKKSPTSILQAVDGTPLKTKVQHEVMLKQSMIQHLMKPQVHHEAMQKYRGKHKPVKHIPGVRGNLVYPRKVTSNHDYLRKGKIKPELRREFKHPSTILL